MPLSVYVEGSKDTSAAGVKRLASLIAARYGLAAADLEKRLVTGRFRVKANVDAATAHAFASDLEALGARCSIVEAEVSGPIRGLKGMPALEQAPSDPSSARVLTPNSARTITASAVPPPQAARTATPMAQAARTATPMANAASRPSGMTANPITGSSAALRPASGLSAATSVREPDGSSLNPPTFRGASGLSAATVPPAAPRPPSDALDDAINPPTLRGLSSTSRTPAHSMPPVASRTATLPFAGYAPRPGSPSSPAPSGSSGLASALADANYGASSSGGSLGALDGASFSLSTLDGQEDGAAHASSSASIAASYGAAGAGSSYADSAEYESESSTTPTITFDDPPVVPAPGYESYPPRRPGTGRTSTPLRPATSSGMSSLSHSHGQPTTGSTPALRPSAPSIAPSPSHPYAHPSSGSPSSLATPSRPPPHSSPAAPSIDLFAPPPEAGPAQLHLAEELPRQRASSLAQPRHSPEGAPMMAPAIASPFVPRAGSDAATARRLRDRLRLAFAAGVLAAVVLGFVPAHLVAKGRERTAFERIDNRARIAQSEISSMAEWNALDDVRTALLRQKRAAQQEIAMLSVLLWVGLTGALSFAWARFGVPRFDPGRSERED